MWFQSRWKSESDRSTSFFHASTGIVNCVLFCTASGLSLLKGPLSQQPTSGYQIYIQTQTHSWPLHISPASALTPAMGAFWSGFAVIVALLLSLLKHLWPVTQSQLPGTGPYIAPKYVLNMHTIKEPIARGSKTTLKHLWNSTMFDFRCHVHSLGFVCEVRKLENHFIISIHLN